MWNSNNDLTNLSNLSIWVEIAPKVYAYTMKKHVIIVLIRHPCHI